MLVLSSPESGEYLDLFKIYKIFNELTATMPEAETSIIGLIMNADAGFKKEEFRDVCKDKKIEANIDLNKWKLDPDADY